MPLMRKLKVCEFFDILEMIDSSAIQISSQIVKSIHKKVELCARKQNMFAYDYSLCQKIIQI